LFPPPHAATSKHAAPNNRSHLKRLIPFSLSYVLSPSVEPVGVSLRHVIVRSIESAIWEMTKQKDYIALISA
jgi:hypothetical protein